MKKAFVLFGIAFIACLSLLTPSSMQAMRRGKRTADQDPTEQRFLGYFMRLYEHFEGQVVIEEEDALTMLRDGIENLGAEPLSVRQLVVNVLGNVLQLESASASRIANHPAVQEQLAENLGPLVQLAVGVLRQSTRPASEATPFDQPARDGTLLLLLTLASTHQENFDPQQSEAVANLFDNSELFNSLGHQASMLVTAYLGMAHQQNRPDSAGGTSSSQINAQPAALDRCWQNVCNLEKELPLCSVCQHADAEVTAFFPCNGGHVFHPGCLEQSMGHSPLCPLCRSVNFLPFFEITLAHPERIPLQARIDLAIRYATTNPRLHYFFSAAIAQLLKKHPDNELVRTALPTVAAFFCQRAREAEDQLTAHLHFDIIGATLSYLASEDPSDAQEAVIREALEAVEHFFAEGNDPGPAFYFLTNFIARIRPTLGEQCTNRYLNIFHHNAPALLASLAPLLAQALSPDEGSAHSLEQLLFLTGSTFKFSGQHLTDAALNQQVLASLCALLSEDGPWDNLDRIDFAVQTIAIIAKRKPELVQQEHINLLLTLALEALAAEYAAETITQKRLAFSILASLVNACPARLHGLDIADAVQGTLALLSYMVTQPEELVSQCIERARHFLYRLAKNMRERIPAQNLDAISIYCQENLNSGEHLEKLRNLLHPQPHEVSAL